MRSQMCAYMSFLKQLSQVQTDRMLEEQHLAGSPIESATGETKEDDCNQGHVAGKA